MLIAVYGSLKKGHYNYPFFLKGIEKKGDTTTPGRLYSFGAYPALVKDASSFAVACEVYDVPPEIFNTIDAMERGAGYYMEKIKTEWGEAFLWCYLSVPTLSKVPQILPTDGGDTIVWEGP